MALPDGIEVLKPVDGVAAEVLSSEALAFVALLHREFEGRRQELLGARVDRQGAIDAGERPDFLAATKAVREDPSWRVAEPPPDLATGASRSPGPPTARW